METKDRKILDHSDRRKLVGKFYASLAHQLLGGCKAEKETYQEFGDVILWDAGVGIEVKASNYSYSIRIPADKLAKYCRQASAGFPLELYWYVFFRYASIQARENGRLKRHSLAQYTPTVRTLCEYLASRTRTCHVFDLTVVEAIRKKFGTVPIYHFSDEGGQTIDGIKINFQLLKQISTRLEETIPTFGLNPDDFVVHHRDQLQCNFNGYLMNFEFTAVVRKTSSQKALLLFQKDRKGLVTLAREER